jgi:quinol monooxygenase YgiN
MSAITVIARSQAKAGKEKELLAALRAVVGPTHQEAGCLKYIVHHGAQDPTQMVVVEKWTSKADLDKHLASPHVQELFRKAAGLVAAPPEIIAYEAISEGDPAKGTF